MEDRRSLIRVFTFVSAGLHKNGFIVFIASSLLHMLITCRLWHVIRTHYVNPEVNKTPVTEAPPDQCSSLIIKSLFDVIFKDNNL